MREEIVSFETAKLAKKKGLQIGSRKSYCHYHKTYTYDEDPNHPESRRKNDVRLDYDFYTVNNAGTPLDISNEHFTIYEAPTQSLLQKWLREVHNIHIGGEVRWNNFENEEIIYEFWIKDMREVKVSKRIFTEPSCLSYEEALEKGLQEALKLI